MRKKSVAIVGAGIAGLSAGCYLQMNGYETKIFEAHKSAGGLCTSWIRSGFTIEGCIHGLLGSAPTHSLYGLWNELIDMDQLKFIDEDIKHLYLFEDGRSFIQYASLEILQKTMIEIAPEDKDTIDEFINDIKKFQSADIPYDKPKEFLDLPGKLKMLRSLPMFPVIKKWIDVSSEEFSSRFKNSYLQNVVKHFSSPVLFEMFVLSEMDLKRCGYPAIGSSKFISLFEEKYIISGGEILFDKKVNRVITENNLATGIALENGENHHADMIVLAMDGKTAVYDFLDGRYVSKDMQTEYEKADLCASKIQISLGINKRIEGWPRTVKMILSNSYSICDGSDYSSFDCQIYNDLPGLEGEDKSLVVIQLDTKNGEYWADLRSKDMKNYRLEKNKIAEDFIGMLSRKITGFSDDVEMIDVATPATYIRYTGNWKGSTQGWSNENIFRRNPFSKQLPRLKNLFMIGQWVEPGGGVPNSFKSGRDVAQIICRKDKKVFQHTK